MKMGRNKRKSSLLVIFTKNALIAITVIKVDRDLLTFEFHHVNHGFTKHDYGNSD